MRNRFKRFICLLLLIVILPGCSIHNTTVTTGPDGMTGATNSDNQQTPTDKPLNALTGLKDKPVILFIGSSITDGGRKDYKDKTYLGNNHPKIVANKLRRQFKSEEFIFYNTGVSGDTALDVFFRLQEDCFDLNPDYIIVQGSVNDAYNNYNGRDDYEKRYRYLLEAMMEHTDARIILLQPYLLEADDVMQNACVINNINSYIPAAREISDVVCSLAAEYGLDIIYFWEILEQLHQKGYSYQQLSFDAIHPTQLAATVLSEQIILKLGVKDFLPAFGEFDTSEIAQKYESQAPTDSPVLTDPYYGREENDSDREYYFAVGAVDETAKTAKVLTGDGEVLTINWDGNAPVAGTVNPFTKEGDVYYAQRIKTFPIYSDSFSARGPVYVSARQKRLRYSDMFFVTNETIFFVRYSDTEWRVHKGRDAIVTDGSARIYLYAELELDGLAKVLKYGMVVGNYADEGKWPAANKENTAFLDSNGEGWDIGVFDLS